MSAELEEASDGLESIMCSILNVVIDHSIEDPTPMEPEEYQNRKLDGKTKVPVIRIFGPLLRDPSRGPLQSACLYIHGAFPYLLARPVIAGPDGSYYRRVSPVGGQVNWDDPNSVQRILDPIQTILEDAIQTLDMERRQQQDPEAQKPNAKDTLRVIRKISVVQGRGFYTYCPGPVAPFLRVEYFDPKLRWKVKMVLERGLQVPLSFYPDPEQYDRDDDDPVEVLKFHCYEAHIPYTMQFFKDWNLAGMAYIHVQRGKIRPSLRESCSAKYRAEPFDKEKDSPAVFLRSNTPDHYLWPTPSAGSNLLVDNLRQENDAFLHDPAFQPPSKGTTADVEIDCTVQDIRNIDSVLKTLPSDLEERDKIQWRAVPSLQEVWRQERQRMGKLLAPEQDFLSPRHMPLSKEPKAKALLPFTLNVKQGAERSGAKLAVKGMNSLVKLTHGLEEDFERSLRQILIRHQHAIEQVDQSLQKPQPTSPTFHTPRKVERQEDDKYCLTPNVDDAIEALASLANADVKTPKTPSLGDAVQALESLQEGIEDEDAIPRNLDTPSSFGRRLCPDLEDTMTLFPLTASQQSQTTAAFSYPSSQDMKAESLLLTTVDPAFLSQIIDRGDSVFQDESAGRENIEDYIDAETLLPYENLDFEEDRCRVQFTVATDPPGTIRICGNLFACCRREGHFHQDECDRARPGYYKTVTTGTFVDGILDTSRAEHDDDEKDKDKFEKALSILASQIPTTQANSNAFEESTHYQWNLRQTLHPNEPLEDSDEELKTNKITKEVEVASDDDDSRDQNIATACAVKSTSYDTLPLISLRVNAPNCFPAWVMPSTKPPCRSSLTTKSGVALHGMANSNSSTPEWLSHAASYMASRGESAHTPKRFNTDSYLQPVAMPPTSRKVKSWYQKIHLANDQSNRKITNGNATPKHTTILQIDSNSRKMVAVAQQPDASFPNEAACLVPDQKIEEVNFRESVHWQLSMTQKSHDNEAEVTTLLESNVKTEYDKHKTSESNTPNDSQVSNDALHGIGAQGGRIHVQGGGTLKAKTRSSQSCNKEQSNHRNISGDFFPSPISFMSIEIHVQCRTGVSRLDSKKLSMAPDSSKDKIFSIVYAYGIDPGGGEALKVLERCCLFVPFEQEKTEKHVLSKLLQASMPKSNLGVTAPLHVECLSTEKRLLLRLSSLVTSKDPDMLLSWDTQGAGLGYIIERAVALSCGDNSSRQPSESTVSDKPTIDMVRLLGRTPFAGASTSFLMSNTSKNHDASGLIEPVSNGDERKWKGSGLGSDWDERVGAGAAASSIVGRLVFAGWKIVSEEVKHPNYSYLPAIVAAVLNKRIPHHDDLLLTQWYSSGSERWRVLHHRLNQSLATLLLFDALDIVGRAGEAARLSGVEFSQSFPGIRGSQYKVEGVLLRALRSLRSDERGSRKGIKFLATPSKTQATTVQPYSSSGPSEDFKSATQSPWKLRRGINDNVLNCEDRHYFFFSPSLDDTNRQEALEVQALTLEPQSGHYKDPVVVCDFTALYPSLVIAYNLCYSTCAGKLEYHSTRSEMQIEGRTSGRVGPFTYPERRTATVLKYHFNSLHVNGDSGEVLKKNDRGYVSPTGAIYVAEDVLKGVLPQVLDEILTTRAMLKRAAKEYKKHVKDLSPAILRQLEARQLALKYVANVTYGYTSATFSGRCAMPLLADTIVECGRKTLRKAINMANKMGTGIKWKGARVIYGDTDSLFVQLPGRSRIEAFEFGEELCRAVTSDNPPPVQLKLEKVYVGSIMQTMKRYCGMKYESINQKRPTFEAKGLETVRRDQCSLTQKILKNALITLFQDDIDGVREYLHRQWSLIEAGHISVADFILTGRVRSKYRGGRDGPVQAVLAKRIGEADPGRIIRHKERLPYVIVATPGVTFRLKDCVLTPLELLERWDAYTIHSSYYIKRHVNSSLQRCLGLAPHFIDVNAWYEACPKPRRRIHFWPVRSRNRAMITTYFGSDVCSLCRRKCQAKGRALVVVCPQCRQDRSRSSQCALLQLNQVQTAANILANECSRCNGCFEDADTFASVHELADSHSLRQRTMDMITGCPGGEFLRLPLANCVCIDCPNTFRRHNLRESLIEAQATCDVLDLL